MTAGRELRTEALRIVLLVYAVGHLVTTVQFLFWPGYFLTGDPPVPPWPLTAFQFGDWPPLHQGFMNVIAVYDLAVAAALVYAMRDPAANRGILFFAIVLWVLHGGVHAYHILWGDSPAHYWVATVELWLGAVLLGVLWPRSIGARAGQPATSLVP
ncbi:MAG TPA: hypothetical protein VM840_10865 [Actinomycetota bacterium]|nr:hypothetical protein [Actinomycetota bacterium]